MNLDRPKILPNYRHLELSPCNNACERSSRALIVALSMSIMLAINISAALMLITALIHSILGEIKLIRPILDIRTDILAKRHPRRVLRFAWHATSILMILCAVIIIMPDIPYTIIAIIGAAWFVMGILDMIMTRGQHIGWVFITAAGGSALYAVYYLAGLTL